LFLEAARFVGRNGFSSPKRVGIRDSSWDGTWEKIDTVELHANKANLYSLDVPLGICRVRITLEKEGEVAGWVNLSA